ARDRGGWGHAGRTDHAAYRRTGAPDAVLRQTERRRAGNAARTRPRRGGHLTTALNNSFRLSLVGLARPGRLAVVWRAACGRWGGGRGAPGSRGGPGGGGPPAPRRPGTSCG